MTDTDTDAAGAQPEQPKFQIQKIYIKASPPAAPTVFHLSG